MSPLENLFGEAWPILVECLFFPFDLTWEERQELGEALSLICAEHINAQIKRK